MRRIQVILPEEIADVIEQKAVQEDRSISSYARKLIMDKIKNGRDTTGLQ